MGYNAAMDESFDRRGEKSDAPLIWEHAGKRYVTNLFKLHDTFGFPLAASLDECRNHQLIPCLDQFVCDAIKSGWSREKAQKLVAEAKADSCF